MAAPLAARVPPRPARRPPIAGGGRQGDPRPTWRCSGSTGPAAPRSTRCTGRWRDTALIDEARTLLGPRRGGRPHRARAQRNEEAAVQEVGFWPQGLATSPVPVDEPGDRLRRRDPLLRPHRGRRGTGPVADAAAHAGAAVPLGLHDGRGRHRAGNRAVGPPGVGRRHAPSQPAAPAPPRGAHGELPHAVGGRGAGGTGPRRGSACGRAAAPGPPVRPRAAHRPGVPGRARHCGGRACPRGAGCRSGPVGWRSSDPSSCFPS